MENLLGFQILPLILPSRFEPRMTHHSSNGIFLRKSPEPRGTSSSGMESTSRRGKMATAAFFPSYLTRARALAMIAGGAAAAGSYWLAQEDLWKSARG